MITAALIGNPNSGKTTVFNKLTGSIQKTGNWPGVTVERKEGFIRGYSKDKILVVDLPGIYSLSPYSPEEVVSRDYLIGTASDKPDVAINILDASNLERGLYLLTQVADLAIPMVVILNMTDVAEKSGMVVDAAKLSEVLGCEVVETVGTKGQGTASIAEAVQRAYDSKKVPNKIDYGAQLEDCVTKVSEAIGAGLRPELVRWASLKLIERDSMVLESLEKNEVDAGLEIVSAFEKEANDDGVQIVATARYEAGSRIQAACLTKSENAVSGSRLSDKIDSILINRVAGIFIFIAIMYVVYYISVQTIGTMGVDFINDGFDAWVSHNLGKALLNAGVDPFLHDLIISGIIAGVGAVIGFLPQIIVLFFCLAILEECGYMARVAFLLDRIFYRFGLSGKAVIPAVIGIGCGVPAIMGTRTIEDESNRNVSVMCTTFMPCSAKLPIMTVVIAAFFHASAAVTLGMYLLGIVMILLSGLFLKKFPGFIGKPSPFVMELPVYHCPMPGNVITSVVEKSWAFVKKAGTLILLSAVIIWLLASFGTVDGKWFTYLGDNTTTGSYLSAIGNAFSWIFVPLGFGEHWELSVATITGLLAKENLLGTVAVLINSAVDGDDFITSAALASFTTSGIAMSMLIFNLLCAPCFAAIGAMRRELGTWRKTLIAILYQCATAYGVSAIFYQFWLISTGGFSWMIIFAIIAIIVPVYVIAVPNSVERIYALLGKVKAPKAEAE